MTNSLLQLAGLNNQSQALANQQNYQNWGGLSSLLGYLSPLMNQGGGATTTGGTSGLVNPNLLSNVRF